MPSVSRKPTIKGVAPPDDEVSDLDILEVDGERAKVPRVSVVVPPPSVRPHLDAAPESSSRMRAAKPAD